MGCCVDYVESNKNLAHVQDTIFMILWTKYLVWKVYTTERKIGTECGAKDEGINTGSFQDLYVALWTPIHAILDVIF